MVTTKFHPPRRNTGDVDTDASQLRFDRLPNGMKIAIQNRAELHHFYEDIFEKKIYTSHGVTLGEEPVIFDVGANIGLFTLFVQREWPRSRVFAFEPAPPLFEVLSWNVSRWAPNASVFNCGISSQVGDASFTFYPETSGMSSFFADLDEEREALQAVLRNEAKIGVAGAEDLLTHFDDYAEGRLRSESYVCRLRALSEFIRSYGVDRIDLMKIDVQKSELAVLESLDDSDWPKVRQIVIEVHDIEGRVAQITELLLRRGFEVSSVQDEMYVGSTTYNLYALRGDSSSGVEEHERRFRASNLEKVKARAKRQRKLNSSRRSR